MNLEKDSYCFMTCLQQYANHHALQGLATATDMLAKCAAACLIVVDVWQCMHKIKPCNVLWQPMVEISYMFPTMAHDGLTSLKAQHLKETIWLMYR